MSRPEFQIGDKAIFRTWWLHERIPVTITALPNLAEYPFYSVALPNGTSMAVRPTELVRA